MLGRAEWAQAQPYVVVMIALMGVDVATGLMLAWIRKQVSSSASFRGMAKKIAMLLAVGTCAVLDPFVGGILLAQVVALALLLSEAISVLENLACLGVPIPKQITAALERLRGEVSDEASSARRERPASTTGAIARADEGETRMGFRR